MYGIQPVFSHPCKEYGVIATPRKKINPDNGQINMRSSHKGCNSLATIGSFFHFLFLASCVSIFGRVNKYSQNCTKS